jgi:hypothetical protein
MLVFHKRPVSRRLQAVPRAELQAHVLHDRPRPACKMLIALSAGFATTVQPSPATVSGSPGAANIAAGANSVPIVIARISLSLVTLTKPFTILNVLG